MPDITVAVSERVFSEALRVLVDNLAYEATDRSDFGAFSAGYDVRLVLEEGTIDLRDDNTIELSELDLVWDRLEFWVGVDIPEISLGGGCLDLGWLGQVCLPGVQLFSADPDIKISLDIGPFVRHELSAVCRLTARLYDPATDQPTGLCKQLQDALGIRTDRREWRFFATPQTLDIDPFDVAGTVAAPFEDALALAIDNLLPAFAPAGLADDVARLVEGILDLRDDVQEWLSDLLNISFGLGNLVATFVARFLGECVRVFAIEDPFPVLPAAGGLMAVRVPLLDVTPTVSDTELTLTADLGA